MAEWVFFISLFLIFYTYLGYPLLLLFICLFAKKDVKKGDITPEVTVIIPVYNEERIIEAKLQNCLNFNYPPQKLKIVVVSDYSSDRTSEIVEKYQNDGVTLLKLPFRGGKVAAQNYALRYCHSEIIIFTDVAIMTNADCVRLIVKNFADNKVGVVSCRDAIVEEKNHKEGERSYIRYDMMVRKYTSKIGSMIGVTGGFYAVRDQIARGGWNPAFPPDFYIALRCIKQGLRVIEDSMVKAYYKTAAREWDELNRKVRTINRGMHALFTISNRNLLNPFKHAKTSLELFSHKVLRWMTPFSLMGLFFSNIAMLDGSIVALILFIIQLGIYLLVPIVFLRKKNEEFGKALELVSYFFIANIAILKAWYEFLASKKYVMWQPTKR